MARTPRTPAKPKRRAAAPSKAQRIDAMERFIRAKGGEFLDQPNVTSVGIGYKTIGGVRTDELAIQFAVDTKTAQPEALGSSTLPTTVRFEGMEFPTDVVQRGFKVDYVLVEALEKDVRKQRLDTVVPGVSVGHPKTTAGTLGAIVRDRQSGRPVMLSNWHVLQTPLGKLGDPIAQPGPYDDNRVQQNRVGTLLRSHLGVAGDCALASLESRAFDGTVFEVGTSIGRVGKAELDDKVVKSGRTTGVTRGIVTRVSTVTRLNYGNGVTEDIGGFEIGPDPDHPAASNEISKGGDSGSAWLAIGPNGQPTDIMLGLHFGGDDENSEGEYALAAQAHSVFEKLEIEPLPSGQAQALVAVVEALGGQGYDRGFLGEALPIPTFTKSARDDLATLDADTELKYCHFSSWLSRERRLPRMVAWNIDGKTIKYLGRKNMAFRKDERGDLEDYQIGDELYANNPFDKGHVARRADLCWGTAEEAALANRDSFYFTNMTPQHERFNQSKLKGLWGLLENAVFDEADPKDLKVSLLGGPILARDDPRYSKPDEELEVRIPTEFWKIVMFADADGTLALRGYILTQADLVKEVVRPETLELDEFKWFQVAIADIGSKTGIRFPARLQTMERMPRPEGLAEGPPRARLIRSTADFFA
jgi:endonuclease G